MTTEPADLDVLLAVAQAATPDEGWLEVGTDKHQNIALYSTPRFSISEAAWRWGMGDGVYNCDDPYDDCHVYVSEAEAQAAFIAAASPDVVMALVARVREAEAGLAYLKQHTILKTESYQPEYDALRAAVRSLADEWENYDSDGYAAGDGPDWWSRTDQLRALLDTEGETT